MKPYKELTIGEIKNLTEEQIEAYGDFVKKLAIKKIREDIKRLKEVEESLGY